MRMMKQFVLLCVWSRMIILVNAASLRNPENLDDIIDLDRDYLTYNTYHPNDDVSDAQYNFRVNKGDNFVPLRRNSHIDLNSPMCYIEGGQVVCELGSEKNVQFYHDDSKSVAVAIANENGTMKMTGILSTENQTIDISPLESTDLPTNRYHVIKKRWTANLVHLETGTRRFKRGAMRRPKSTYSRSKSKCRTCKGVSIRIGIGYGKQTVPSYTSAPYTKLPPTGRPGERSSYCIDILCVVDYSIYSKFLQTERTPSATMKKIRYYYAHVINGVNIRYASIASSDLLITVRLAGYFIAKRPGDLPFIDAYKMARDPRYRVDSNYTLTSLDSFLKELQRKQSKRRTSSILPKFNHAMLFLEYTSTNFGGSVLGDSDEYLKEPAIEEALQHEETKDGISGDKGGTSFVSGICSPTKSTSLVVDHGAYTSAGIATHELGHNLGVYYHDGEGTARSSICNASYNYIMAPASFLIDHDNLKYSFTFSPCSISQIKENLKRLLKRNKSCLLCSARDRSSVSDMQQDREFRMNLETLPGQVDDVHSQCQQLYGKESFMCPPNTPEEMCYRMYCYDPKRGACAIISEQMAAPGTPCGRYKVCNMGKCVQDTRRGIDTLDDCPYPDIPSPGAHCEDAMPYMCKNLKFRKKCCSSCNKKFTPEEACKDVHILINGLSCKQLMVSMYGRPGCSSDYNVQNMCCISCKKFMKGGSGKVMIHIGVGSSSRSKSRFSGSSGSSKGKSKYIANKKSSSKKSSSKSISSKGSYGSKVSKSKTSKKSPSANCVDANMTINGKFTCQEIVQQDTRYCQSSQISTYCCASCFPFT